MMFLLFSFAPTPVFVSSVGLMSRRCEGRGARGQPRHRPERGGAIVGPPLLAHGSEGVLLVRGLCHKFSSTMLE